MHRPRECVCARARVSRARPDPRGRFSLYFLLFLLILPLSSSRDGMSWHACDPEKCRASQDDEHHTILPLVWRARARGRGLGGRERREAEGRRRMARIGGGERGGGRGRMKRGGRAKETRRGRNARRVRVGKTVDGRARRGAAAGRGGRKTRRGHDTTLLNVGSTPVRVLARSVVKPTLSRALCPVLVGISGAPTGPIRERRVSDHLRAGSARARARGRATE